MTRTHLSQLTECEDTGVHTCGPKNRVSSSLILSRWFKIDDYVPED